MQKRQDPRRFLLSGFEDSCKFMLVSLYIGSCSNGVEHTWEILDDEKILVTFKSDIGECGALYVIICFPPFMT